MTKRKVLKVAVVKALQRISDAGAVVTIPGGLLLPAAVVWCRGDKVYWCQLGFEDQHHTHCIDVVASEILHAGKAIWLTASQGQRFYFAADTGRREWQYEREKLQRHLSDPAGRQQVARFLMDAIGDAPEGWIDNK